jgi:hypothetical protein
MQCVYGNLQFSHLLKIKVYPLSHFQLFLTCCFCQYFCNPFFFYLEKQHPVHWRNFQCRPSKDLFNSPSFKCPRVHPCEFGCIHEDPLSPIPPGGFNFSADGWNTWGCLAVFPRLKGRTQFISILLFDYYLAFIMSNRCIVWSTIIPELGGWVEFFFFLLTLVSVF